MRQIWITVLVVGALSACANVSRFEKNPLVAYGEQFDGARETLYYCIVIETGKGVEPRMMDVSLKLTPDALPLKLSGLRPESVARYLPRFSPPPEWPERWVEKARENEAYSGGGFHITFNKGRLIYVGICSHCSGGREYPVVGTPDGQTFYTLPLTERQLIEVFGSPDRVYKVNEVRY